jgi:hypothetical protein
MCLTKGAFVGEKNFDVIKMHGTTIKIRMPYWRERDKGLISSVSRYEVTHHPSNSG